MTPPAARSATRTGRVLVLGGDSRSGLTVARSLGRAGLIVDLAWPEPGSLAPHSRYVRTVHDLPHPTSGGEAWKVALIDLLRRESYDLVIPCSDRAIIPLQHHRDGLARYARIYTLDAAAFEACFDKYRTTLLADRLGLRLPRWSLIERIEDLAQVGEDWPTPLVLKPLSSFDLEKPTPAKRMVRKLPDRAQLDAVVADMLSDGPVLLQGNFSGRGVGVELIAEAGRVLAAFQHERVHEPLHGGGSSYRRSVPLDPELKDAAARLAEALDYTGVMMVEFRVDPRTGDWILVEINGRFWGSLPLAVAAGANFPLYLYQLLVEGKRDFPRTYRTGLYCRNLTLDLPWLVKNLRADRSDPTLQTRSLWQVAAELRHLATLRERSDTLTLDDPAPGLRELGGLVGVIWQRTGGSLGAHLRGSAVGRQIAARRIRGRMARARHILFVCKGNICRSPFAERYARQVLRGDITVASAGYYPKPGRSSPAEAQAAARRLGMDLGEHRSCVLDDAAVNKADLIFVFDTENRLRVTRDFPQARGRVFDLGALLAGGPASIADPWEQDADDFDRCYGLIKTALNRLAAVEPRKQESGAPCGHRSPSS